MKKQFMGNEYKKRVDFLTPEEWYSLSLWDDVACGVLSASIVFGLCSIGWTPVAWTLLLPMVVVGGYTVTYHLGDGIASLLLQ